LSASGNSPAFAPAFNLPYHEAITRAANDGLLGADQLNLVVLANKSVDLDQFNSCLHFDNCAFACGIDQITQQWASIDSQPDRFGVTALWAFGRLLHTTQDFYAHSTWVEVHTGQDPLPVWDQQAGSLPPGLVSGTFLLDFPKLCASGTPSHAELNKDGPDSPEGEKTVGSGPNQGKTLFQLAMATATAASKVQFDRLRRGTPADEIQRARPGMATTISVTDMTALVDSICDRATLERNSS
jgi:hypothetical protein